MKEVSKALLYNWSSIFKDMKEQYKDIKEKK